MNIDWKWLLSVQWVHVLILLLCFFVVCLLMASFGGRGVLKVTAAPSIAPLLQTAEQLTERAEAAVDPLDCLLLATVAATTVQIVSRLDPTLVGSDDVRHQQMQGVSARALRLQQSTLAALNHTSPLPVVG